MNTHNDRKWQTTKRVWKEKHPPTLGKHNRYYQCAICLELVHYKKVSIDHIIDTADRPDLAYELRNLQATHSSCNQLKGAITNDFRQTNFGPRKSTFIPFHESHRYID